MSKNAGDNVLNQIYQKNQNQKIFEQNIGNHIQFFHHQHQFSTSLKRLFDI